MEKKRIIEVGEITITGNILCPLCQRWTGQNAQIDIPPYHCPYCELDIELLPNQEHYYKEVMEWRRMKKNDKVWNNMD